MNFKETMLSDLVDKSNKFFKSLHSRKCITEKELKYFSYQFKKTTNLGKLYLLPKIHKRLSNVSVRPVRPAVLLQKKRQNSLFLSKTINAE